MDVTYATVLPERTLGRTTLIKTQLHSADLSALPDGVVLLRTGFDAPFSLMPDRIIELALATEADLLARSKVAADGLWVDIWLDPRLVEICQRLQIPSIISPRISRSGTLSRFAATRPGYAGRQVPLDQAGGPGEEPPVGPAEVSWPGPPESEDPDLRLLKLTFTRLMSRIPERPGVATLEALPAALNGAAFLPDADPGVRRQVREAILSLRQAMALDQRRGDQWGRLRRIDWDGDGREEIEIESHWLLAMFDPARAALPTVTDKIDGWPLSSIRGDPGWLVARHMSLANLESATPISLVVTGLEEAKDHLVVRAVDTLEEGRLAVEMTVRARSFEIEIDLEGFLPGLIGPELSLLLDSPRVRVDGSEWAAFGEPEARMGHKFRLADDNHEVMLSSLTPMTVFVRPVEDGVVAWAHWNTDGASRHRLSIQIER